MSNTTQPCLNLLVIYNDDGSVSSHQMFESNSQEEFDNFIAKYKDSYKHCVIYKGLVPTIQGYRSKISENVEVLEFPGSLTETDKIYYDGICESWKDDRFSSFNKSTLK